MISFMILGAQKAATSAIQSALRANPEVYMPKGESAFFEEPEYSKRHWERFGDPAGNSRCCGIKRPDNLCSTVIIDRIRNHLPDAKFIIVLRDPVSRAVSAYYYMVRHGHLPALPLNAGVARCLDHFENQTTGRARQVIDYGLYGHYLSQWLSFYPRERFLVLSQKEVAANLTDSIKKCCEHLGIGTTECHLVSSMRQVNVGLYDPGMLKLARIGSLLKTKPLKGSENRRVPRSSFTLRVSGKLLTSFAERFAAIRKVSRETLSPENLDKLHQIYAGDEQRLRGYVDSSVVYWNFGDKSAAES